MAINTREAFAKLRERRNPAKRDIPEVFAQLQEDESTQYLVGAMEPVDAYYTQLAHQEAGRVYMQLRQPLYQSGVPTEHAFQGSTTKNTHILAYSDIDLLVVEQRFVDYQHPLVPENRYMGEPLQDLLQIRHISHNALTFLFRGSAIEPVGYRAIKVTGGLLSRPVDVVPANWVDTMNYRNTGHQMHRGIQILNNGGTERECDFPWLHGNMIDTKDHQTLGNARKLIRLLKTLKYDSDGRTKLSSFDIEAIIYRMDTAHMQRQQGDEILLAIACRDWLRAIEGSTSLRDTLEVPDGTRKIFANGKATLQDLVALRQELDALLEEIQRVWTTALRNVNESRVRWPQPGQPRAWA